MSLENMHVSLDEEEEETKRSGNRYWHSFYEGDRNLIALLDCLFGIADSKIPFPTEKSEINRALFQLFFSRSIRFWPMVPQNIVLDHDVDQLIRDLRQCKFDEKAFCNRIGDVFQLLSYKIDEIEHDPKPIEIAYKEAEADLAHAIKYKDRIPFVTGIATLYTIRILLIEANSEMQIYKARTSDSKKEVAEWLLHASMSLFVNLHPFLKSARSTNIDPDLTSLTTTIEAFVQQSMIAEAIVELDSFLASYNQIAAIHGKQPPTLHDKSRFGVVSSESFEQNTESNDDGAALPIETGSANTPKAKLNKRGRTPDHSGEEKSKFLAEYRQYKAEGRGTRDEFLTSRAARTDTPREELRLLLQAAEREDRRKRTNSN